jgi:hypothetical protein
MVVKYPNQVVATVAVEAMANQSSLVATVAWWYQL